MLHDPVKLYIGIGAGQQGWHVLDVHDRLVLGSEPWTKVVVVARPQLYCNLCRQASGTDQHKK